MAFDSAADLLFNIGANSDDAEANIARFRSLLGTDLDAMGAQFSDWADKVFGDLSTVQGAMRGITAASAAGVVAAAAFATHAANDYEKYAIAIGDAALKTGLTTQELSAMHLAANELGVSFDQVTTGIVRFERGVFAAQSPTSKQAQTLAQMGFSTDQVRGAMTNIAPFLEEFGQKFAALPAGPEKTGVALEFMGRAGANNIKFMQVWAQMAEEMRKKAADLGIELSPTDVLKAQQYQAAIKGLHSQWEAFSLMIGREFMPMLTKATIFVGGFVEALKNAKSGLDIPLLWLPGVAKGADETERPAERAQRK